MLNYALERFQVSPSRRLSWPSSRTDLRDIRFQKAGGTGGSHQALGYGEEEEEGGGYGEEEVEEGGGLVEEEGGG